VRAKRKCSTHAADVRLRYWRCTLANWPDFRPTALIGALIPGDVDFVVIGGVAVVVQASPRITLDLDISYTTDTANLKKLGGLLLALDAKLSGAQDDVPFTGDARTLRHTQMPTLTTREGDLDHFPDPSGLSLVAGRAIAAAGGRQRADHTSPVALEVPSAAEATRPLRCMSR
jgi:hypothetical protein